MKKNLLSIFSTALAAVLVLTFSSAADAQGYGSLSKKETEKIIKNLETESDIYRRSLDNYLDDSKIDGSDRETRYNSRMKEFEKAVDDLQRHFDSDDKFSESRAKIEEMVRAANPVNDFMLREAFNPTLQVRWKNIRKDINRLAKNYDLPRLPTRRYQPDTKRAPR